MALKERDREMRELSSMAALYSFLGEMLGEEVGRDTYGRLIGIAPQGATQETEDDMLGALRGSLSEFADADHALERLAVDYAGIFLGANRSTRGAFPYESVYTSPEGLLQRDSTEEVLRLYCGEGFVPKGVSALAADHIALEFSFMGRLLEAQMHAVGHEDREEARRLHEVQLRFFKEHIEPWVLLFLEDGRSLAKTDFYHCVFDLVEALMVEEASRLRDEALGVKESEARI